MNKNSKKDRSIKKSSKKQSSKKQSSKKEKFYESVALPSDILDILSKSPSAGNNPVTWQDQLQDFGILFIKYLFLVTILTLNFLGLSVSLNCNADQEMSHRIMSAIFAFFFGFVYLIINYYTFKVLSQGKICKMDREKLFPFKA